MRIPPRCFHHGNARAIRACHDFGSQRAKGRCISRVASIACHRPCGQRLIPKPVQLRVRCIHLADPRNEVGRRIGQGRRRIRSCVGGAAQCHGDGGGQRNGPFTAFGKEADKPVHPACLDTVRQRPSAFEDILSIKMRSVPVGGSNGVNERSFARRIEFCSFNHGRMECEKAVELGAAVHRQCPALCQKLRITRRDDRVEPVRRPALDDEDQPLVGRRARKR